MTPADKNKNPFVGPASFSENDKERFFGRKREINNLYNLLIGERIALLYAVSGAGKTSLIQAGLIPKFKGKFQVIFPIRVNEGPPELERKGGSTKTPNRYVWSVLQSFENQLESSERLTKEMLAELDIQTYLQQRRWIRSNSQPKLLVFDQFEELFIEGGKQQSALKIFFKQLGEALQNRQFWALFVIREDYLAGLSPYRRYLPTYLAHQFQLGLLNYDAAKSAIVDSTTDSRLKFGADAATKLIKGLCGNGANWIKSETSIEPLHLQIVCHQLWNKHAVKKLELLPKDIKGVNDIIHSLSSYFDEQITALCNEFNIAERRLRNWFSDDLISVGGFRRQIRFGSSGAEAITRELLEKLQDLHLIRKLNRSGEIWVELVHDRMVDPIQKSNQSWRSQHLVFFQARAEEWYKNDKPDELLLTGKKLEEANECIRKDSALTPKEGDIDALFLDACRKKRKKNGIITIAVALFIIGGLIAAALYIHTDKLYNELQNKERELNKNQKELRSSLTNLKKEKENLDRAKQRAETHRYQSLSQALAANLLGQKDSDKEHEKRALLARQAYLFYEKSYTLSGQEPVLAKYAGLSLIDLQLRSLLNSTTFSHNLNLSQESQIALAFEPHGHGFAFAANNGTVIFRRFKDGDLVEQIWQVTASALSFSPASGELVAAAKGEILFWDRKKESITKKIAYKGKGEIKTLTFDPKGRFLAVLSKNERLSLWDLKPEAGKLIKQWSGVSTKVAPLFANHENMFLAYADNKNQIIRWDMTEQKEVEASIKSKDQIIAMAFSPNGEWVVYLNANKNIHYQNSKDPTIQGRILSEENRVNKHVREKYISLLFKDDDRLITGSEIGTVRQWNIKELGNKEKKTQPFKDMLNHHSPVERLIYQHNLKRLISIAKSGKSTIRDDSYEPLAKPQKYLQQEKLNGQLVRIRLSQDGKQLASGGTVSGLKRWSVAPDGQLTAPIEVKGKTNIRAIAFSSDGRRVILATAKATNDMVIDLDNPVKPRALTGHSDGRWAATFHPENSNIVTTASWDGRVNIWNLSDKPFSKEAKPWCSIKHEKAIMALAFSNDGNHLYSAGRGGYIHRMESTLFMGDKRCEGEIKPDLANSIAVPSNINAISLDSAEKWLATAGEDGVVRLYEISNGQFPDKPQYTLRGHEGSVNDIAFSTDGRWLVSGSDDKSMRIWFMENLDANPIVLTGHKGKVLSVEISPDMSNPKIISSDTANSIYVWEPETRKLADMICKIVWRNLSIDEWQHDIARDIPYGEVCK